MRSIRVMCLVGLLFVAAVATTRAQDEKKPQIDGWGRFENPLKDGRTELVNGVLHLSAPGPVHDLSIELGKMNAPRVLQPQSGDFVMELKVDGNFNPGQQTIKVRSPFQSAGILVMADAKNYLRLERAVLVRDGKQSHYTNYEVRIDGRLQRFGMTFDAPLKGGQPTWLRLVRKGNDFFASVRQDSEVWVGLPVRKIAYPAELEVGVAVVNASTRPVTATFSDLKLAKPNAP